MPVREMKFKIRVVVEPDEDAGLFAHCPDLQGVAVEGATLDDIKKNIECAVISYLESLAKHNDPIPAGVLQSDEAHDALPFIWKKLSGKLGISKGSEYVQEILFTPGNHATA